MSDKVDQLSLDAAQARKKGMTYGKYMQWKYAHQGEFITGVKTVAGPYDAVCKQCGKIFPKSKYYRSYCSRLCKGEALANRKKAKSMRGAFGS